MLIAVDSGHCPKSTGAVGYIDELTENRKVAKALVAELKARGHKVVETTPADSEPESLSRRAQRANDADADFFVSTHFNAGGGTGVEAYTTNGSGAKSEAAKASAAVAELLGLKNRGHKTAEFTVLVKTNMPAMLIETCFVDSSKDAEAYRASTPEKVAAAIAYAIVGGSKQPVSKPKEEPKDALPYVDDVEVVLHKLSKGSQGEQVETLQRLLNALGYASGDVDGVFGAKTHAAVVMFQKGEKLEADGVVGRLTWSALLGV